MNETKQKSRNSSRGLDVHGILALAGIVGPLGLIATDFAAAFSQPGYNFVKDSISSLALTSLGWIQTIGFLVIGLLVEIFTAGLFLNVQRKRGFGVGIGLLVFFGFSLLLIGAFRTDPVGAAPTIEGRIHLAASYAVFGFFPIAISSLIPSIRNDPKWRGMFLYTAVTAGLAFALTIGWWFLPVKLSYFGLYERIMVANAIVWVEVVAIRLLLLSVKRKREVKGQ
jgi:MFS family permease